MRVRFAGPRRGETIELADLFATGSLGVLWYGDPGPSKMINRHEAASAPLSTNLGWSEAWR